MGITFTKEQQQVIDLRNRNILVSAAAGSGKTAVLVERIIARLTRDEPPLDVDRLLIVTYTEAAASEMKERIHSAIEKALEETPENVHLQRQATLIHQAQITTIHKFCLSVIRDYFHVIDLDPGFRVAEEGELKLLKKDVAEAVLEAAYQEGDAEFVNFVESFASGRDDRKLEELILQLYEFSRSYPNPKKWLDSCVEHYEADSLKDLQKKPFVLEVMEDIRRYLMDMQELLQIGMELCEEEDGPRMYQDALRSDLQMIAKLLSTDTFTDMQRAIRGVQWTKLTVCRDPQVSEVKKQQVKEIRNEVKETVKSILGRYFFDEPEEMLHAMVMAKRQMGTLIDLVKTFSEMFSEEKRRKNLIDFNDMEQYALQILNREENGVFVPSSVAENYQEKFAEIMIDEYQDSNLVQETILTSVSGVAKGNYNIFMVGDVKQSIYRFRLSKPELFMEKFHSYRLDDSDKQRIDLHKNFRSRREVLDSTNFVFEQIMTPAFGGIDYDENAALYVGADYEQREGNETEVLLVEVSDSTTEERMEFEAEAVAQKIKSLMEEQMVYDKKSGHYRNIRYRDIVVLTRSLKGWMDVFSVVLNRSGIPTYTSSKEGYFQTQEIRLVLQYLKILDNPRQDIPFAAVLTSMMAGFTSEEMATIRSFANKKTLYECVCAYLQSEVEDDIRERLRNFMMTFEDFRKRVPYTAIDKLLWQILEETGYGDYAAALPGGEQRAANLEMLIEKAVAFEKTSYKGLFNFVRYIEQLEKYDVDYGEANLMDEQSDVVSLMSIHKSKGLEFPIVFVAGMGKQFNLQDTRQSVVIHPDLGVGVDAIDSVFRTKTPTLLKRAIQQKIEKESKAEELRVLYVAMTRAKEKLILTGATSDLQQELGRLSYLKERKETALPYYSLTKAKRYMDWILPAVYRNQCSANVLEQHDILVPYQSQLFRKDIPIVVNKITAEDLVETEIEEIIADGMAKEVLQEWDVTKVYDSEMQEHLKEQFAYRYLYEEERLMKQKLSVSELKKSAYADEEGEEAFREEEVIPLLPKFLQGEEEITGASKGTAYHKLLELLDFTKQYDEASLQQELQNKQREGLLTKEMLSCIRVNEILCFLRSPIAERMRIASRAGRCYAEQPFVLGLSAKQIYKDGDSEETVLVQGIIDVYFEEDDELVLLDYKTDRVYREQDLAARYRTQLEYYAEALERLTGKNVKEKKIYSFALQKEIEV